MEANTLTRLSRKDACRRLLRSAIVSFVKGYEPLSVHLCVQAAFRVCRDVIKHKKPDQDWFAQTIRPERLKEFLFHHARIANFLKHADRNPIEEIEIGDLQRINEHDIFLLCNYYDIAFGPETDPFRRGYFIWYILKYPDMLSDAKQSDALQSIIEKNTERDIWIGLEFLARADESLLNEARNRWPDQGW